MSIQSPAGTLDIKNATLRVGKLEVSNIQGVDTALNVTRANSVLIYDDQASTTTFTGFTSTPGVRDTVNGYLDVADGYVYWGQKLPNAWVMDFEMDIRSGTNPGPLYANVFSTTNTGGDGYSFTFNDSNDKISLYYYSTLLTETTVSGLFTASEDWQKVVINYERGLIVISLDGSRKFYYKDIERETPYVNGEYVSFTSASTDGRKIRDLRVVNGEKWIYSGESNVVYTQGSVGIGVTDPTVALDVSGTVKATAFDGDGSAITNISSANVGDFASNVVRIENLETSNGHIWSNLASNVTILRDEIDSNLATARTDLQSNVTILRDTAITFMGTKTFQDDVVLESNLRVQGDLLVANTVNMTVSDPILELGSNNLNTGDVGIVMTRHGASNSNVAVFFDETADTLKLGYTLNGAGDSTLEFDSNALAVSVQGALTASTGTFSGDVGIGTTAPGYTLDVDGDINFTGTFYQGGSPFVSSLWTDGQDSLYYRSNVEVGTANLFVDTTTSRVGINTITPGYDLDVDGDINFTGNFYQGGSPFVSSEWTTGSESLYYRSNVEIGTANLFVDTTTSRVGINTITPGYDLDVHGTSNVGALTATSVSGNGSGLTSLNATNISSGTINKDRLPGTLNNTTIGSLAIGANDVTLTAKVNYHGLKILKAFDSPDEPATLLLAGDGDTADDIAFEIRGNATGSSVDTTTTRNSNDTKFGILHTGHTYIGYPNLNPGESGGNAQSGDSFLNVNGDISATTFTGSGSGLTSLNASNISTGTLGTARIPNLDAGKITTGTLTRPISTTTGTFSGVVTMRGQQDNADGSDRASYWNYDDKVALVLEPAADDGAVAILFPSQGNKSSDFAYIVYDEDYGEAGVTAGENGALILGCENDGAGSSDHVRIKSRLVVEADHSSSDPTNAFQVKSSNTTSDLFTVTRSGNVGIGTTSPAYKLDVHGTSNVGALTATSVSGNGSGLTSLNATNISSGTLGTARIPNLDAGKITTGTLTRPISTTTGTFSGDFEVGTANLFVDVSTSNVGIGTVSPAEKLHLNGNLRVDGTNQK